MADYKNGHWYTDKMGNHYFVENGQTPKEGWEASKRRKMISNGEYKVSEDGNEYKSVTKDEYDKYEADDDFDLTNDDDFGFDEDEDADLEDMKGLSEIQNNLDKMAQQVSEHLGGKPITEDDFKKIQNEMEEKFGYAPNNQALFRYMNNYMNKSEEPQQYKKGVDNQNRAYVDDKTGYRQYFASEKEAEEYANRMNEANGGEPQTNTNAKQKPLHIQSLENQVARNPDYKAIADSLSDDKDVNNAYFYAFKDAYEKHGYEPSNKQIADELEDAYFRLQDDYRDRYGMNDSDWDWHGESAFEREYGTMSEFIDSGLEAHNRHFDESGPRTKGNPRNPEDLDDKPDDRPAFHYEGDDGKTGNRHIVIDEGPHKGERYDNWDDYRESNKKAEYKAPKKDYTRFLNRDNRDSRYLEALDRVNNMISEEDFESNINSLAEAYGKDYFSGNEALRDSINNLVEKYNIKTSPNMDVMALSDILQSHIDRDWDKDNTRWNYSRRTKTDSEKETEKEFDPEYQRKKSEDRELFNKLGQSNLGLTVEELNDVVAYIRKMRDK